MKLNQSSVVFNSENHTYTLDGKPLSGITSLLHRQLFKDMYKGVDEKVLQEKADYGTMVHQTCELADNGFPVTLEEGESYLNLTKTYNLIHEESEYLVSDNTHFASSIDKVYREDETTFHLADIKTTYNLNKEYVKWQLSIYAYFFEMQNPGATVGSIFAIWFKNKKAKRVLLDRIPSEEVERLLTCDAIGIQYIPDSLPVLATEAEQMIIDINTQLKLLEEQEKNLREGLMRAMVQSGLYSWKGERVSITRKTASSREDFDKARFKEEHPELYQQYVKETLTSESLTIKVK